MSFDRSLPAQHLGDSHSPPLLPLPRQPSPLSVSSLGHGGPPSPTTPGSSFLEGRGSVSSASSVRASTSGHTLATPTMAHDHVVHSTSPATSSYTASTSRTSPLVPITPSPDSLLLRSTFTALEHSTTTLKRLSKAVLNTASVVAALAEQLEKAEDELFVALGDLGRWLENGYGISAEGSVWEQDGGIRKINREKRRREREEREAWVDHGLKAVKAELKRNGLAGHGAHARFEQTAKQFYHQTSIYLSPQTVSSSAMGVTGSGHSQLSSVGGSASGSTPHQSAPGDMAQAVRHAQWDLTRYNHHSTLLYAIPPSSLGCLDLLVGLYGWVGGLLGETPGRTDETEPRTPNISRRSSHTPPAAKLTALETPVQILSRPAASPSSSTALKVSLSTSLSHLARVRAELLQAWAERNYQTTLLEDELSLRQAACGGGFGDDPTTPVTSRYTDSHHGSSSVSTASGFLEHKKGKKMHKIHRSVGGRLKDFLTSSPSSNTLSGQAPTGDRSSRLSLDGGRGHGLGHHRGQTAPTPVRRKTDESTLVATPTLATHPEHPLPPLIQVPVPRSAPVEPTPPTVPSKTGSTSPRPGLATRHSMAAAKGGAYVSPLLAATEQLAPLPSTFTRSPDLREVLPRHSVDSPRPMLGVGGVGGLGAGGDEDERREEAGRKKEGVLWGLGTWEGLTKSGSGKGKWEKFWVVLDHSKIYEYRDIGTGKPENAHAVIDLKFASVREGRGTDRRFVFEIVTPSQGKRLYQATSDTEMKLWLYAICNAIESCINGTSSVRTFDASKLRTVSGSLDDHALPARGRLGLGFNSRAIGLGFPLPPGGRRSMPPTPTDMGSDGFDRRSRKTSLKKVLKQSGERLSSAVSGSGGGGNSTHRNSFGGGLEIPRPYFGKAGSRTSLPLSTPEFDIAKMPPPPVPPSTKAWPAASSTATTTPSPGEKRASWVDGEIEKRVLEMAGLGLGLGMGSDGTPNGSPSRPSDSPNSVKRRVKSEAVRKANHPSRSGYNASEGEPLARSRSDDAGRGQGLDGSSDMYELRRIAGLSGNDKCADCGKGMKSSRWATISVRRIPMVLFICIRCCGIHRSLGTHISKPRSVDLDIWTPEMIHLAQQWGNERGNLVWEAAWDSGRVGDDQITDFIKAKYVEGRWLSEADKVVFGIQGEGVPVGRAI